MSTLTLAETIRAYWPVLGEQQAEEEVGEPRAVPLGSRFPQRVDESVEETAASFQPLHSNVSRPAPREHGCDAPVPEERLQAAADLAAQASGAIRALRAMTEDENPAMAHEARRLLRELGAWLE